MRLIQLGQLEQHSTGIAAEIRAALTATGRGNTVVGGIALLGVTISDGRPMDAVVITPHGIHNISSVTLSAPALRLEAPLHGTWRADGWRVESTDGAVNPARDAIGFCEHFAAEFREQFPTAAQPVGTIIAVGPYVEHVEQPAAELAGATRVLYPSTTSMLSATVSMPRRQHRLTTSQLRELLTALAPDAPQPSDAELYAEGFAAATPALADEPGNVITTATTGPVPSTSANHAAGQPRSGNGNRTRWLPTAALTAVGCALIAVAVTAMAGNSDDPEHRSSSQESRTSQPATTELAGVPFVPRHSAATTACTEPAFGDIAAELEDSGCRKLHRASFTARVKGTETATTVAVLSFADRDTAENVRELATEPGTGGIHDVATERGDWPGRTPQFAGSAYVTDTHKATVRLVRTTWLEEPSEAADPALQRVADAALQLPLP